MSPTWKGAASLSLGQNSVQTMSEIKTKPKRAQRARGKEPILLQHLLPEEDGTNMNRHLPSVEGSTQKGPIICLQGLQQGRRREIEITQTAELCVVLHHSLIYTALPAVLHFELIRTNTK